MNENDIGQEVVDAAIVVHRELGPGLLETVYEIVLLDELRTRGLKAEHQVPVAIQCRGIRFDQGFRADIIVEKKVILELKSVRGSKRDEFLPHPLTSPLRVFAPSREIL